LRRAVSRGAGALGVSAFGLAASRQPASTGPADGQLLNSYCEEVEIATGNVLFRWSAADHVPLADSYLPLPTSATVPYDFFHINSISITPTRMVARVPRV
jgi:hypothetical protein